MAASSAERTSPSVEQTSPSVERAAPSVEWASPIAFGNGLERENCGKRDRESRLATFPVEIFLERRVRRFRMIRMHSVDDYLKKGGPWQAEMIRLRAILLDCGLQEELKWGKPCYTFQESNIVILQGFKAFCAVLFAKGALLADASGILEKPGKNTQAARRIRIHSLAEVEKLTPLLQSYFQEAIAAEKAGLKVDFKINPEPVPEELERQLEESVALKRAFSQLTPGRQRAYILFFSAAKQSKTRQARIAKCLPAILQGKGLND